jgi:hypothetical protein
MLEPAEIERMSPQEKMDAIEKLWEALARDEQRTPSPGWHAQVLANRKQRVEKGESRFLTLDELKARLNGG